ncbi:cysteine desulfurase SufS subfamily protein [Alishewanella agri BL06]|uniref:cysteine desulfurase n=1 Tax=Alishewanella agri BL06 TaxID=1195246 RepID=I9P487_9ALTE|nr:cysteine desulfurase [Alishewanella agri]EIW89767.1 cysteine desulfurase SufS subfamily protein [Alishewanella agri BL06]
MAAFNPLEFRQHFPFFQSQPDWIYLDNAATTHKPQQVIAAELAFYQQANSNVHRGAHQLSQQATALYEDARETVKSFLNARYREEIIFTSGTTAAFNQLAFGLMHSLLKPGDRILISTLEHHANIVPWQLHCLTQGVILDVVPLDSQLMPDLEAYQALLALKPKVVSLTQVSNALGHILPLQQMLSAAKAAGAITIVDGAQGIAWQVPDLQQYPADFYCFSGHKLYGPTGIGVLYGKTALLEQLKPLLGGGEMISEVSFQQSSFAALPARLEAGTPNIAGAIGLATAIRFLRQFDAKLINQYKGKLLQQFADGLAAIPGLRSLTQVTQSAGILSLQLLNEHPNDLAVLLNEQKIAVRAGSHCAMPLFASLQLPGAVRFAFAPYNLPTEVEKTLEALQAATDILR